MEIEQKDLNCWQSNHLAIHSYHTWTNLSCSIALRSNWTFPASGPWAGPSSTLFSFSDTKQQVYSKLQVHWLLKITHFFPLSYCVYISISSRNKAYLFMKNYSLFISHIFKHKFPIFFKHFVPWNKTMLTCFTQDIGLILLVPPNVFV